MKLKDMINPWAALRKARRELEGCANVYRSIRTDYQRECAKTEYIRTLLPKIQFRCPDTGRLLPKGDIPPHIYNTLRSLGIVHH